MKSATTASMSNQGRTDHAHDSNAMMSGYDDGSGGASQHFGFTNATT
jgi:hypothetical protein